MIYIFHDNFSYSRYILNGIKDKQNVTLIEVPLPHGLKRKLLKWGERLSISLYTPISHNKEKKAVLRMIKPEDEVILFDFWTYENVRYLIKHLKCNTVHVWFWNTLNDYRPRIFSLSTDKTILFHTFDPQDANQHEMFLHNQIYRLPEQKNLATYEIYDFFFIGLNKGRFGTLKELNSRLLEWGYTTKFIIVDRHEKCGVIDGIEIRNKEVDYNETLQLIRQSKVLVDCTKTKQSGITLRVIEGLFLNKKVLSNNSAIKNLPFYTPSRIFFMNELNDKETLKRFMRTPILPATEEEKKPYDINHWIQEIVNTKTPMS